jgi:hypothetical protein
MSEDILGLLLTETWGAVIAAANPWLESIRRITWLAFMLEIKSF